MSLAYIYSDPRRQWHKRKGTNCLKIHTRVTTVATYQKSPKLAEKGIKEPTSELTCKQLLSSSKRAQVRFFGWPTAISVLRPEQGEDSEKDSIYVWGTDKVDLNTYAFEVQGFIIIFVIWICNSFPQFRERKLLYKNYNFVISNYDREVFFSITWSRPGDVISGSCRKAIFDDLKTSAPLNIFTRSPRSCEDFFPLKGTFWTYFKGTLNYIFTVLQIKHKILGPENFLTYDYYGIATARQENPQGKG